jgi:hypothetical protein
MHQRAFPGGSVPGGTKSASEACVRSRQRRRRAPEQIGVSIAEPPADPMHQLTAPRQPLSQQAHGSGTLDNPQEGW